MTKKNLAGWYTQEFILGLHKIGGSGTIKAAMTAREHTSNFNKFREAAVYSLKMGFVGKPLNTKNDKNIFVLKDDKSFVQNIILASQTNGFEELQESIKTGKGLESFDSALSFATNNTELTNIIISFSPHLLDGMIQNYKDKGWTRKEVEKKLKEHLDKYYSQSQNIQKKD